VNFLQKKPNTNTIRYIELASIKTNPNQPRTHFDSQALAELALSIKQHGILQPLTVRAVKNKYELIAGERRLRASRLAGLDKVPCIVIEATDEQSSILALIENLQRKDLDFFETALGYQKLINTYGLTQAEAAAKLGKSQSAVANKLRLLQYSPQEIEFIRKADLSERHARAVLRLPDHESRFDALSHIALYALNVRDTDQYIEKRLNPAEAKPDPQETESPELPPPLPIKRVRRETQKMIPLVRDVRIFVNSVNRAVDVMRSTGINASYDKTEEGNEIILTVRIPKNTVSAAK